MKAMEVMEAMEVMDATLHVLHCLYCQIRVARSDIVSNRVFTQTMHVILWRSSLSA